MRLDKFLSNLKYGSRREIQKIVKDGYVTVNDEVILNPNTKIDAAKDSVYIFDELVFYREELTLALNKPEGYVSANIDNVYMTVMDLLEYPYTNFDFKIAGRLDVDSTGLVIITTNGPLAHQITSPNSNLSKLYVVTTDVDTDNYKKLEDGVIIKDGKGLEFRAKAINVTKLDECLFEIEISEGKFHQVKRMFEAINLTVTSLKRTKIGKLELGDLEEGTFIEVDKDMIL